MKETQFNAHVTIYNMGCSKNLVDSERIARRFADAGMTVSFDDVVPPRGAVVVVNTCGFIGDAKEESIGILLDLIKMQKSRKIKAVYAMGCLIERYRKDVKAELPELKGIYGKFDWDGLITDILGHTSQPEKPWARTLSTPSHYTYIKIADGCNRFCAFCAIPLITGRHKSRPEAEILEEVAELAGQGVREFNIVAQDLSSYGTDLPDAPKDALAQLIDRMADIDGVEMIRLHYAYPSDFPYSILPVMARRKEVCKYLDIALQHIDDTVLANMRRHITAEQTRELLARIRREVPGIQIRTTMMTGFPGETEEAFERLLDFVREQRFERLGAFAYCEEDDTYAARKLSDDILEDVKKARLDRLMAIQEEIATEIAAEQIGRTLRVIIDEENGEGAWIGRTEFDSPDVDNIVTVRSSSPLEIGNIYPVEITGADYFDLEGNAIG